MFVGQIYREQSTAWFQHNMLEPFSLVDEPSAFNSILRVAWKTMYKSVVHRDNQSSIGAQCTITNQHGKDRNGHRFMRFPPSAHVLRGMLGMRDVHDYERHVCPLCWRPFDHIPHTKESWQSRSRQRCDCGGQRFVRHNGVLRPTRRYWVRSLRDVLESFFRDDNLAEYLGQSHTDPTDGSFFSSPYCRYLDTACQNKITEPGTNEIAVVLGAGALLHRESPAKHSSSRQSGHT